MIKHTALIPSITKLNRENIVLFNGINPNQPILSLGTVDLILKYKDFIFPLTSQVVVSHEIRFDNYDGILGVDFFRENNAVIDYNKNALIVKNLTIPFENNREDIKKLTLQPRSETIVKVNVINDLSEGIIRNREIDKDIFIPNALVKNMEQRAYIYPFLI